MTNTEFLAKLKPKLKKLGEWTGYLGTVSSAVGYAEMVGKLLGIFDNDPGMSVEELYQEMLRIAEYQDAGQKRILLDNAWDKIDLFEELLQSNRDAIKAGTYTGWPELESASIEALNYALAPGGSCTGLWQFQVMSTAGVANISSYEWRPGIETALRAVTDRLAFFAIKNPNYRNDSWVQGKIDEIRTCLMHHRDLIRPPHPSDPYCKINSYGTTVDCKEQRAWPQWSMSTYSEPIANYAAMNAIQLASYLGDLEGRFESKADSNDLAGIVFSLQRQIDNLYITSHPTMGDLAEKEDRIRFGANPQLCLSLSSQNNLVLDACQAEKAGWSYDRATGRIKNKNTGNCIGAAAYPSTSAYMAACDPAASTKEEQVWSWNPETGRIKNSLGAVLTVADASPRVLSSAGTTFAENAWRLRQQVWRSDGNLNCAGALCVRNGPEAWNWGSITKVVDGLSTGTVSYPLDFNIFAYDQITGFYDIENPIAVAGTCNASGFSLNRKGDHRAAAMVVGVDAVLNNGSIYGFPYYTPWWKTLNNVTVLADGYTEEDRSNPINFEMAFLDLDAWSQSLGGLSSSTARAGRSDLYGPYILKSEGAPANPKLEVFNIISGEFRSIYSLRIDTPAPIVLINVDTSHERIPNVYITNMEISGADGKTILWNFPEAGYVEIRSVGFKGAVLAPRAEVRPNWGYVQGTMVAWSMIGTAEFHADPLARYQEIR